MFLKNVHVKLDRVLEATHGRRSSSFNGSPGKEKPSPETFQRKKESTVMNGSASKRNSNVIPRVLKREKDYFLVKRFMVVLHINLVRASTQTQKL